MQLRVLTNSEMKARRRCARYHHLRYNLGLKPLEDVATLRFGDLVHVGLEAWWNWHKANARPEGYDFASDLALDAAHGAVGAAAGDLDAFELVKVEELLRGYHYRWGMAMADLEVIAVEVEFRAPLINPETGAASRTFEQGGKLDVLARERSTGRVLIVEHKTSSEDIGTGSTYWRRLRMDSQISTYLSGAAALGFAAAACLYDVIGKPTIRPSKATPLEERKYTIPKFKQCPACKKKDGTLSAPHTLEGCVAPCEADPEGGPRRICTDAGGKLYANLREFDETAEEYRARLRDSIATEPEKYFQRGEVVRLEDELRDHGFDLWAHARAIADDLRTERAPKNPDGCVMYGRTCGYFDACSGAASLDDPSRFERLDNVHQELATKVA